MSIQVTDILIVEDDLEFGQLLHDFLVKEGFSVRLCADAEQALLLFANEQVCLVLLDVMLPGMNGYQTCTALRRKSNVPILMMSAAHNEAEQLMGYETGADDYIDKPFSIQVLIAKIRALQKRNGRTPETPVLCESGIVLDCVAHQVTAHGVVQSLNAKEFLLLQYLMRNAGRAIDRNEIFDKVWGDDCFSEPSTVSVHIRWLREKLEVDPNAPVLIQTVRKVGYRFGTTVRKRDE